MPLFRRKSKVESDPLETTAAMLVTVGALNWGLVGLLNIDLVAAVFGRRSALSRLVYAAVGASAVYLLVEAASD